MKIFYIFLRLIVLFSVERLIVVCFPIKIFLVCNQRKKYASVLFLTVFAFSIYSFSLITSGLEHQKDTYSCVTKEKWFNLVKLMAFIDTILTMIIPFFLISISNILIVIKLFRFSNPFKLRNNFKADFDTEATFSEYPTSTRTTNTTKSKKEVTVRLEASFNEREYSSVVVSETSPPQLQPNQKKEDAKYGSFDTLSSKTMCDAKNDENKSLKRNTISVINISKTRKKCKKT